MEEELYDDLEDQQKENTTIEDETKCKVCFFLAQFILEIESTLISVNPANQPTIPSKEKLIRIDLILTEADSNSF